MAFEDLKGVTLSAVEGLQNGSEHVRFVATDGRVWHMWYEPDCCASAAVHDLVGEVADLIGSPILLAEEASNNDNPPEGAESHTWTFYKLATSKGYVTITWLGESNGFYSESVSFEADATIKGYRRRKMAPVLA